MKKLLSISLILCFLLGLVGCKKADPSVVSSVPQNVVSEIEEETGKYALNPLTGEKDLKKDAASFQPVAIMINNISTAWGVQSGLSNADVIYEAYVEGGITRLLAVYKDIRAVKKLGSLRSARYSFADLAAGHGARFVHAGKDEKYCTPRIEEIGVKSADLNSGSTNKSSVGIGSVAYREDNGLPTEHTLFTTGKKLYDGLKKNELIDKVKQDEWMNFVEEDAKYTPDGGKCKEIFVPFSGSYGATFKYNKKTKLYDKYRGETVQKDAGNNKKVAVGNVLVLYSNTNPLPDGKHVKTDLTSGEGYYVSRGGYMDIKWSKGEATDPFVITDSEGEVIDYNPGSTYVCLTQTSNKKGTSITE